MYTQRQYQLLNLPSWLNDGESDLMVFYDYLADGTKVALHREDTGMGRAWLTSTPASRRTTTAIWTLSFSSMKMKKR